MKKELIIGFCLLLVPLFGSAQQMEQVGGKVALGIKAGWIQSDLYGKHVGEWAVGGKTAAQNSFFVGLTATSDIGKYFAFRHEVFYQQYGADFDRELFDETIFKAELKMKGLKINPISPTFKLGGLQIYAGPYINILLESSITAVDEDGQKHRDHHIFGTGSEDTQDYKYLQKMDYGLVAGIDYVFKKRFSIGAYYSRGFAPIFDNANSYGLEENPGIETLKIYNESFGVSMGFYF